MKNVGVKSIGIKCPIIRQGDNLVDIVYDSIKKSGVTLQNGDVIGITESVVARAYGDYITVDMIASEVKKLFGVSEDQRVDRVLLMAPIFSRNRFAIILRGIARACKTITIWTDGTVDEVGNVLRNHPFTGLNYDEYYIQICKEEGCLCDVIVKYPNNVQALTDAIQSKVINCTLHLTEAQKNGRLHSKYFFLTDLFKDKCEYGLLGSNKSSEEKIKLFPSKDQCMEVVCGIQTLVRLRHNVHVEAMIYGDGCFKSPIGGIWEFADPVVSPGYTSGLEGCPREIKIKAFADDKYKDLSGKELEQAIRGEIVREHEHDSMSTQGTTPRRYVDLLGSLMDLTSGSGDKGTPVVIVQNYFKKY